MIERTFLQNKSAAIVAVIVGEVAGNGNARHGVLRGAQGVRGP
jgi:hypothetical protein